VCASRALIFVVYLLFVDVVFPPPYFLRLSAL